MDGFSLKSRAIAFAICAGAVAFILALAAVSPGQVTVESAARALIAAIVCSVMCWASAERSLASTAGALDSAILRMSRAAKGDLQSEVAPEVHRCVPPLAIAMEHLFGQLRENIDRIERLALFDPVTDLPNRTHFRRHAEALLAELPRGGTGVLYFVDLDRFKVVNDTLGHAMGDVLLGRVASRLRAVAERFGAEAGSTPMIGRLAGDEFTLYLPNLRRRGDAERLGVAILLALSEPFDVGDQQVSIGASIGVAHAPDHGATLHDLMRAADAAMYRAKASGRGRVEYFSDALAAEIVAQTQLEGELRHAIAQDDFALFFQPQVSARDGRVVGAEALLRWHHQDGTRLPGVFLRRAEETGLIVEIGDWVVSRVAETISRWGRMGVEQRLAVNISAREIDHASFFRRLRTAMHLARAPATLLEIEITETLAMHCSDDVIEAITLLRADGASIAVDDFGTGYSNLARLRQLPIDRVKLDRSLVEHVVEQPEARSIAQAVISLVHGIGCEAVAEGIESEAQASVLRVIGCDVLQGYAFAQPMDEELFLQWVRGSDDHRVAS